jgi:hypothetical protein
LAAPCHTTPTPGGFAMSQGIAAPAPRIMVTVLGVDPDVVRVFDARRAHSDTDVVRVEFGDCHLAGPLRLMTQVIERAALELVQIEQARNGGEVDG